MAFDDTRQQFEAHCLRVYVSDIVSQKSIHLDRVARASSSHDVPVALMEAIALIEANRRPKWIRFTENVLVLLNAALHTMNLASLKDVTIGMYQVKLSMAARLSGISCSTRGGWIRIGAGDGRIRLAKARNVAHLLSRVLREDSNASIAAEHVGELCGLWKAKSCLPPGNLSTTFLHFIGNRYNDHEMKGSGSSYISYGRVLAAVVKERRTAQAGSIDKAVPIL